MAKEQLDVFAQLHERDSNVLLLDPDPGGADDTLDGSWQPSHGSDADFSEREEQVASSVKSALSHSNEVHLFGVGLGGAICVAAAAQQPQVRSLTVLAGWLTTDRLLREHIELYWTLWEKSPELAQRHSSLMELSAQYRRNLGPFFNPTIPVVPAATPRTLRRLSAAYHVDVTQVAAEVTCPTLVVAPTRDAKIPPEHSYELFAAVPDSTLLRVESGHGALLERLSEVFSAHLQMIRRRLAPGVHAATVQA